MTVLKYQHKIKLSDINQSLFIFSWFATSLTCLIFSVVFLYYLSATHVINPHNQDFKLYAALPVSHSQISDSVNFADARTLIIENFFKGYKSILADYSQVFVEVADKYQLPYSLLPAISMQESIGGKRVIPNSHNPFGYGIYGDKVTKFDSWEQGIEIVGKSLRNNYLDEGLKTPEEIMVKYTPPSLALGGTWAKGVNHFMSELE